MFNQKKKEIIHLNNELYLYKERLKSYEHKMQEMSNSLEDKISKQNDIPIPIKCSASHYKNYIVITSSGEHIKLRAIYFEIFFGGDVYIFFNTDKEQTGSFIKPIAVFTKETKED